jgi:hypothetical protein
MAPRRHHLAQRLYAMRRMRLAIDRAIKASTARDKESAARWAAAWGTVAGIPQSHEQPEGAVGGRRRGARRDA